MRQNNGSSITRVVIKGANNQTDDSLSFLSFFFLSTDSPLFLFGMGC